MSTPTEQHQAGDAPAPGFDFAALPPVETRGPWSAEWWLAVSNLRGGSTEAFVSLITVLSINLMGDGLRDALDPKLKRS